MTKLRPFAAAFLAAAVVACFSISAVGQTASDGNLANVSGGGSSAKWEISATNSGGTLTISFPDGRSIRKTFRAGDSPQVSIGEKYFDSLPDGVYSYELRLASAPSDAAIKARGKDDDPESERAGRKRPSVPVMTQSGSFTVVNGSIIVSGGVEPGQRDAKASAGPAPRATASAGQMPRATASANVLQRIRNNHRAFFMPDDVVPDDQIVQGSECVGLDCVNGEVFGFDTVRLKENNTRLQFDDTSTSQGFPTNNWQIRANDSGGGSSFLGFVDQGATGNSETGTIIGRFTAGAPANSLVVASNGKVGLRTLVPVLDVHMNTSDTPAVRFEQNNSGGFSAQTWDIGANEANFFVRDVTSGSLLPFRIRPGAPTSSLDIAATGNVGIATSSPGTNLDVSGNILNLGSESGATTRTNSTNKLARVSVPPFLTANLRFAMLVGATTSTANIVAVGGEAAGMAAATQIDFVTAATNNTDTGTVRMTVNSSGNVGIATAAPTDTLSVNGTASKPGGGSWAVFSDERLKNIKGRFTTGLNAVMQLQPLRDEYKRDNALNLKSTGENIGFGAGELQKVIPEAVKRNDDGYLMVNNDPILWTMLNAIKEQQKQIADLKVEVQRLKANQRRPRR
jgi:hypothetical protein